MSDNCSWRTAYWACLSVFVHMICMCVSLFVCHCVYVHACMLVCVCEAGWLKHQPGNQKVPDSIPSITTLALLLFS